MMKMYRIIYRVESNKKTREIEVTTLRMSSVLLAGVIKSFGEQYPNETIIRAYLHKLILEE